MSYIVKFPMKLRPQGDFIRVKDSDAMHYSCWNIKPQSYLGMQSK